ncbi:MAG: peptidoglycan-binding protein [Cyanobacteria bacterium Co-bin13]|nr:peptidoglycan-binding protein [Cyanobacteria bacterium Co-bin13]
MTGTLVLSMTAGILEPGSAEALAATEANQIAQSTAPASPPVSPERIARPTLRLGSQGEAVHELQAMLRLLGFYPDTVTGQFQESTQEAVKQFQSATGLAPDGVVGSATWSQLFPTPPGEANPPTAATTPASPATTAAPAPASPAPSTNGAAPSSTPAATPSAPRPANPAAATSERPVLRPGMSGPAVTRLQERLRALGFYRGTVDGVFGTQTETAVKQAQRHYNLEPDGVVGPATWSAISP